HLPHARRHPPRGHLSMIRNRSHVRTLNRRLRGAHPGAPWPAAPADQTPARHETTAVATAPVRERRVAPPIHVDLPADFDLSIFDPPAPFDAEAEAEVAALEALVAADPPAPTASASPVIDRPTRYGRI